eukprot:7232893-Prymnesium_polylepis.1
MCATSSSTSEATSVQAKLTAMARLRRDLLAPKEAERQRLLATLRGYGQSPVGQAIPAGELAPIVQAICAFDESWQAPQPLKARRIFVDNFFADHDGKAAAYADTFRMAHLALLDGSSSGDSDYHVLPMTDMAGMYRIHAKRTHAFCRVGYRFLLGAGEHDWLELEVTQSGSESEGADKGIAKVASKSHTSAVLEGGAPGSCWAFRLEHDVPSPNFDVEHQT